MISEIDHIYHRGAFENVNLVDSYILPCLNSIKEFLKRLLDYPTFKIYFYNKKYIKRTMMKKDIPVRLVNVQC